jgi:hypothetical protein
MPLSADNPQAIVAALARRSDAAGVAARKAMLGFVQRRGAPAITTLAKQKAPKLFRDLEKSGRDELTADGAKVTFGGNAAEYAASVHEERGRLRGRVGAGTERRGKHVYRGSGVGISKRGGGASNPGEWNKPAHWGKGTKGAVTAWANRVTARRPFYQGAQGNDLIEWSGRRWRFRRVDYAKRYPASRYPKAGQPHFLFGAPNSAYGEKRLWLLKEMATVGVKAAGEAARRGKA